MSDCLQCGTCCKAIVIQISMEEIRDRVIEKHPNGVPKSEDIDYYDDLTWIWKHWKPISYEEAIKINPTLKKWNLRKGTDFTYTCKLLKDNKCSLHNQVTYTCDGFPFYGKKSSFNINYNPECGYMEKVLDKEKIRKAKGILNPYYTALPVKLDI